MCIRDRYKRAVLLDRLPKEKHRVRPRWPPCRALLLEFLPITQSSDWRNYLFLHRPLAYCHRMWYHLFHFQLHLRHLFPDKDRHIRRPSSRFPHFDSGYLVSGRYPALFIGSHRGVYRTHLQRNQRTPCLYRIRLQWKKTGIWRITTNSLRKKSRFPFSFLPQLITIDYILPHIIHTA